MKGNVDGKADQLDQDTILSKASNEEVSVDRTQIDDEPMAAALIFLLGLFPVGFYYAIFSQFGTTMLPWKICGAITTLSPALVLIHYFINRRQRRMWWAGCAALIGFLPIWLISASYWLFYFSFAPMLAWLRLIVLASGVGGTIYWLTLVWRDYTRITTRLQLEQQLFKEESSRVVYSIATGMRILPFLKQRSPFTKLHILCLTFVPIFTGILLTSSSVFTSMKGPHAVLLVLSFFSFPLSQYLLAYLAMRGVFFEIYMPLKLERETGKKVILRP